MPGWVPGAILLMRMGLPDVSSLRSCYGLEVRWTCEIAMHSDEGPLSKSLTKALKACQARLLLATYKVKKRGRARLGKALSILSDLTGRGKINTHACTLHPHF